jgi:hypothetical protein
MGHNCDGSFGRANFGHIARPCEPSKEWLVEAANSAVMGGTHSGRRESRGQKAARLVVRLALLTGGTTLALVGPMATAAIAAPGYQEQVTVDASQADGAVTVASLAAGTSYEFTVTGTFSYGTGNRIADAECSTADGLTWSRDRFGASGLDLLLDGMDFDWTPQSDVLGCDTFNHGYTVSYTPQADGPVALAIASGPGTQASYQGSLEVVVTGAGIYTPPANDTPNRTPTPTPSIEPIAPGRIANAPTAPSPVPAAAQPAGSASDDDGHRALAEFLLSDQPKATARPENQIVLETTRPRGKGFEAPSPLIVVPLVVALVVLFRPRQTLAFATDVVHHIPTPGRTTLTPSAPWRAVVESAPPLPSALERPVFTVRTVEPQPVRKIRVRRRSH